MRWLTRGGPFWDDLRRHGVADYLECRGEVVTDHAIGEAAYRALHDVECALVSLTPSDWEFSPVEVTWRRDDEGLNNRTVALENWRDAAALEERLRNTPPPIRSWGDLRRVSTSRFGSLTFAGDCFDPLEGAPFIKSAGGSPSRATRHPGPVRARVRRRRRSDFRGPPDLSASLHRNCRSRIVLRLVGYGKERFPARIDVSPSSRSRKIPVLHLAREGAPPRPAPALFLAHSARRAGLRRVRRPEDHQTVSGETMTIATTDQPSPTIG